MTNHRPVAVLTGGADAGAAIADGLAAAGVSVVRVGDEAAASSQDVERLIIAAAPTGVAAVVDAGPLRQPVAVGEVASRDGDSWRHGAEEPLLRALHVLQGAHRCLRVGGGRIVVLLPALVTTGAAGAVAWVAAAEGYRSLAKAAARTWGHDGVTVNSLLVPADPDLARPGLQPPALGRAIEFRSDIAPVLAALASDAFAAVTGATIAVDGGVWMTP